MPFTAQELQNIANAALDFHMDRGRVYSQTIQDKPLLGVLRSGQKTFPGGKELITVRVKGAYTTTIQGFTHDETVSYSNPANIKEASYPWKEIHGGIQVTFTELKKDGISIVDSATGENTSRHSEREATMLANLFDDKLEDMSEGIERGMNEMLWKDGSSDDSLVPGIRSFILDDPTSATVIGGIDQSANDWWRNRASVSIDASTASNQNLVNTLQQEFRQLRRYGNPRHTLLAGSDLMDAFEKELRSKGNYTETGWANKGQIDASIADLAFKGRPLMYDPTLDDLGLSKYLFVLDMNAIQLKPMDGEDMKAHSPARPEDKYVLYRALTWTGGLCCRQRNTSGVYAIQ